MGIFWIILFMIVVGFFYWTGKSLGEKIERGVIAVIFGGLIILVFSSFVFDWMCVHENRLQPVERTPIKALTGATRTDLNGMFLLGTGAIGSDDVDYYRYIAIVNKYDVEKMTLDVSSAKHIYIREGDHKPELVRYLDEHKNVRRPDIPKWLWWAMKSPFVPISWTETSDGFSANLPTYRFFVPEDTVKYEFVIDSK